LNNEELHWHYSQQEQERLDENHVSGGINLELENIL